LAALAAVIALGVFYREEKVYILFLLTTLIFIAISAYAFTLRVECDGIDLKKKTIFGEKKVKLEEVADLTVMSLRGRYLFLFVTPDRFVLLTSTLSAFEKLRSEITRGLPENSRAALEAIPQSLVDKKAKRFKLFLIILFVFVVGALIWRSGYAGFWSFHIIC
jgi:hypothetical protein